MYVGRLDLELLRVARIPCRPVGIRSRPGSGRSSPSTCVLLKTMPDVTDVLRLPVVRRAGGAGPGAPDESACAVSPAYFSASSLHVVLGDELLLRVAGTAEVAPGRAREGGCVGLRLEVPLQHVPVAHAHHDRPEGEDHGDDEREEHDDLAALAAECSAAAGGTQRARSVLLLLICTFGTCSSRIVAFATSVMWTLLTKKNLYGARELHLHRIADSSQTPPVSPG